MPQQNTLLSYCYTALNCIIQSVERYFIKYVTTLMPIWKIKSTTTSHPFRNFGVKHPLPLGISKSLPFGGGGGGVMDIFSNLINAMLKGSQNIRLDCN